ncbi:MAG: 3-dehydroquinate synthase [Acidobacteria bacterium]|nr:3-dehydroquinate synthase [Acidobacteriota bacterium]
MPQFPVGSGARPYPAIVERGVLGRLAEFVPAQAAKVFVLTTRDVWDLHGAAVAGSLNGAEVLFFPGGEDNKRLSVVEQLAEQMVRAGGDRKSVLVAFGGGIVTDLGGFLASAFLRGIPVLQVPTTLLAQVDAALGGKTGVNLQSGKNLFGAFHDPLAVLIDPAVVATLPPREYRAGLYEVIKHGIIRSPELFALMRDRRDAVLAHDPAAVDFMVADSVRIKADVVTEDPFEGGLRRILNYGHTVGHALEAETRYVRFLHGEAVAFGMRAATHLGRLTGRISEALCLEIVAVIDSYGALPPLDGIEPTALFARLINDKKTLRGKVHFVLPTGIGSTEIVSGLDEAVVMEAIRAAY